MNAIIPHMCLDYNVPVYMLSTDAPDCALEHELLLYTAAIILLYVLYLESPAECSEVVRVAARPPFEQLSKLNQLPHNREGATAYKGGL